MAAYQRNGSVFGSQSVTFNSFIGDIGSADLKVVVLSESQFTVANLQTLIDRKSYGACVFIKNMETFVASDTWMAAYRFASNLKLTDSGHQSSAHISSRQFEWRHGETKARIRSRQCQTYCRLWARVNSQQDENDRLCGWLFSLG